MLGDDDRIGENTFRPTPQFTMGEHIFKPNRYCALLLAKLLNQKIEHLNYQSHTNEKYIKFFVANFRNHCEYGFFS